MHRLFALFVVVLLLIVADTAARSYAGAGVEDELASALHLGDEPRVEIGGFPFLWGLMRGRFDEVTVAADRVPSEAVDLTEVSLALRNVRFSATDALSGDLRRLEIDSARGEAMISAAALDQALSLLPPGVDPGLADGSTLQIEGTELNLGATRLPLPLLADEMEYESARVTNGAIHLVFRLKETALKLG